LGIALISRFNGDGRDRVVADVVVVVVAAVSAKHLPLSCVGTAVFLVE
jgi:hypothetical protein